MTTETEKRQPIALTIDDEPQIRRLLRVSLESAGYRVFDASNGNEGLSQAAQRRPDVILLDLGLPDMDGMSVLGRLREWCEAPVVVLTVRDGEEDKIAALDSGADDYVVKPFSTGELLARIRAALRRSQQREEDVVVEIGELKIDLAARTVRKQGDLVRLTPIEYALFRLLVVHRGKVLTHRQLLTEVWGPNAGRQTHYLRVHIAHCAQR
ncbi:MAG: response regulator [Limisphaerales bacterium]